MIRTINTYKVKQIIMEIENNKRTLKDSLNTPFKKTMFGIQLLS
jgi:hypothetical protein